MFDPPAFGRHQPASHTIIHLSDPHFLAAGARHSSGSDSQGNLAHTLATVRRVHPHPSAIVITGDLTDFGEPDAYRRLRAMMEPVAADLRCPIVWVAGNHDERLALRADLLDGDRSEDPATRVWDLHGLRLVARGFSVPGW